MTIVKDQRIKVLLIDDDKNFGKIIQKEGEKFGINLQFVLSLEKTRALGELASFDALLVDYDLDDATGFEVAEFLNTAAAGKPVIMVSSTNRPQQDKLASMSNIVGFVSKWMRPDEFLTNALDTLRTEPGIKFVS